MQDPVWQGADACLLPKHVKWPHTPSKTLPIKLRSQCRHQVCWNKAVTHKLLTLQSLVPLNHTCLHLFSILGLCYLLPPFHSDCQCSNHCAYCRLPRSSISAWSKDTSWLDMSTAVSSQGQLQHWVARRESMSVLKILLLYDNISCFHPTMMQAAFSYLEAFPSQQSWLMSVLSLKQNTCLTLKI